MSADLAAAGAFMARHARLLDRRRLQLLLGGGDPAAVVAALDGYRNADGGYGWGLEPDLRAGESQPAGALHAFEALADAGAGGDAGAPRGARLCDWLVSASLPGGGLPFALAIADPSGCAPFWADADHGVASLQITAFVATAAHRAAVHDRGVAGHGWLATATDHCLTAIDALGDAPHAYVVKASLGLLDAVCDSRPEAAALLERLGRLIPADGRLPVTGGSAGETLRALDVAPDPDRPVRALFAPETIAAELEQLAAAQQDDGGWHVDFASSSPAATLEWRGYETVRALSILRRNPAI